MTALSAFLRKTPGEALREYFDRPEIGLPTEFDWPESDADLSGPLLGAIEKMSRVQRDRISNDAEPDPMIIAARRTVTGVAPDASASSTSRGTVAK